MRIRTWCFLVAIALVGCSRHSPNSEISLPELPDITAGDYKVDRYIRAAITLQSLGRTTALERLHTMASDAKSETRVIILCRMLFTQRPGSDFRRPRIG